MRIAKNLTDLMWYIDQGDQIFFIEYRSQFLCAVYFGRIFKLSDTGVVNSIIDTSSYPDHIRFKYTGICAFLIDEKIRHEFHPKIELYVSMREYEFASFFDTGRDLFRYILQNMPATFIIENLQALKSLQYELEVRKSWT